MSSFRHPGLACIKEFAQSKVADVTTTLRAGVILFTPCELFDSLHGGPGDSRDGSSLRTPAEQKTESDYLLGDIRRCAHGHLSQCSQLDSYRDLSNLYGIQCFCWLKSRVVVKYYSLPHFHIVFTFSWTSFATKRSLIKSFKPMQYKSWCVAGYCTAVPNLYEATSYSRPFGHCSHRFNGIRLSHCMLTQVAVFHEFCLASSYFMSPNEPYLRYTCFSQVLNGNWFSKKSARCDSVCSTYGP